MTEKFSSVDRLMASAKLSEATKKGYIMRVNQYLRAVKMDPDGLVKEAKSHPKKFEESLIRFLQESGKRSSASTTTAFRDSLKRFLEINRVTNVNWEYVNEFVPSAKKAGQDRAPSLEEIRKIVDVADLRTKCLVLFLSSSGARIGSVPYLRWGDMEEVEAERKKLAKVTIYKGEPEEYTTFITPECYRYWREYRQWRKGIGEKVTEASFVFATQGNATNFDPSRVRVASIKTLKNQLGKLWQNLGMRSTISERGGYRNYEFKQAHGFRKFFKTRMELSGVKPIFTEMLMRHEIGVSGSYMKPTGQELLEQYAKAIPNLTILGTQLAMSKEEMQAEFRKAVLTGVGFKQEEVDAMDVGVLADFQSKLKEKLLASLANTGARQKVVPASEVKRHIAEGWEFVDSIGDEVILKLPG